MKLASAICKHKHIKPSDKEIIEQYLEECDFNDECDKCRNPNKEQSWAKMSGEPNEVVFYLCQSCALEYSKEAQKHKGMVGDMG